MRPSSARTTIGASLIPPAIVAAGTTVTGGYEYPPAAAGQQSAADTAAHAYGIGCLVTDAEAELRSLLWAAWRALSRDERR